MKLLEKILVATDFTPECHNAAQMAVFVAKHFGSKIIMLHVVPGTSSRFSGAMDMLKTDAEHELEHAAELIREPEIEVDTLVDFGTPFDLIIKNANELDVDIVIMANGGGPYGLGGTAAEVRRRTTKPVWIVRPGTAPPIKNILCPVDFSEPAGRALQNAIHLSRAFEAELTILTVAPCAGGYDMVDRVAEASELGVDQEEYLLDRFVEDYDLFGVKATKLIRREKRKPHEEILAVAEETNSDLLVMGSTGRKGLARLLMGGVARTIAQKMPCSVVTVRTESAIRVRLDEEATDIEDWFKQGQELLALGLPEEAGAQFRRCIAKDRMYVPAWEGLAAVHERLGDEEKAKRFAEQAEDVAQTIYHKEIDADIRKSHPLKRDLFGIEENDAS